MPPQITERLFRSVLETAPDGILLVDGAGRITLANQQVETLFGYKRADLLGQPVELLIPERFRPGHLQRHDAYRNAPTIRLMGNGLALCGRRQDGSEFPVEISLSPVVTEGDLLTTVVIRDVSERQQIELALRTSEERYRLLVEGVQDYAIFMLDPQGQVATWNAGAEHIKGYAASEIIGQHIARFYLPDEVAAGRPEEILAQARAHGRFDEEGRRLRKDGSVFWAHVTITALQDRQGELRGFAKVTQDISARKAAEALERTFVATVSHDLRNPLSVIQTLAGLLKASETYHERAVDGILAQSRHLERLTSDLLDASRLQSGQLSMRPGWVDLGTLLQTLVATMQTTSAHHQLGLKLPLALRPGWWDRDRVEQVAGNLLRNALKYSPDGGRITVTVEDERGQLRVAVADQGMGLPAEVLPFLFDRFFRSEDARRSSAKGLGLALFISKSLVEAHGGRIWAESDGVGQGSRFSFTLPYRTPPV